MANLTHPKEEKFQDLLELHQQLIGLEKIEIKSGRFNYTPIKESALDQEGA